MKSIGLLRASAGLCLVAIVLTALACGGNKDNGAPVSASLKDFSITLDKSSIEAGKITFKIDNAGPATHELALFKTDLEASKLPVVNNLVPEDSPQLELIDEAESIKSGSSKKLTVDLPAGHYVLICNVLAHYGQGMYADFNVK